VEKSSPTQYEDVVRSKKQETPSDSKTEEIKVLSRDVKILKQDYTKLRKRVDIIESKLFSTSTPIKDSQQQVTQESYTHYLTPQKDLDYGSPAKIWSNKSDYDKGMEKPYRIPRKDKSYKLDRQSGYFIEDEYGTSEAAHKSFGYHEGKSANNWYDTNDRNKQYRDQYGTSEDIHASFRYYKGKSASNWCDTSDRSKPYKRSYDDDDEFHQRSHLHPIERFYHRDQFDQVDEFEGKDAEYYTSSLQSSRESVCSPSFSTDIFSLLQNRSFLESVKAKSSSIKNFAAKLNCEAFTRAERIKCNVSGLQNKPKLDEKRIQAIRTATFTLYPIDIRKQEGVWKECIKAIDGMNRKLKDPGESD